MRFENKTVLNENEKMKFNKHIWESTQNWRKVAAFVLIESFKGVCVQSGSIFTARSMQRELRLP